MQSPVIDNSGDVSVIYILTLTSRSLKILGRVIISINKCHDHSKLGQIVTGGRNLE